MSRVFKGMRNAMSLANKRSLFSFSIVFILSIFSFFDEANVFAAVAPDSNRTFTHPSEDNQQKNLTLTTGTYTFRTDADPNGYHIVDWYTTYSGGTPVASQHLYFFEDKNFTFSSSGNYWVRAEVYKSSITGSKGSWEAAYRWYVTVQEPFIPEFYNVRIQNKIDEDGDGYARQLDIEFDVDSNISGNYYVKVFENDILFDDYLITSSEFYVNGFASDYNSVTIICNSYNLYHGTAEFKLELYDAANNNLVETWTTNDDTDLGAVKVELSSEDIANVAPVASHNNPQDSTITLNVGVSQSFQVKGTDQNNNIDYARISSAGKTTDTNYCQYSCGTQTATEAYSWSSAGTYTVTGSVVDEGGLADSVTWTVTVEEPKGQIEVSVLYPTNNNPVTPDALWLFSDDGSNWNYLTTVYPTSSVYRFSDSYSYGTYHVQAMQDGIYLGHVDVALGQSLQTVTITTSEQSEIQFIAYYSDGITPLSGATVEVINQDGTIISTGSTDSSGLAYFDTYDRRWLWDSTLPASLSFYYQIKVKYDGQTIYTENNYEITGGQNTVKSLTTQISVPTINITSMTPNPVDIGGTATVSYTINNTSNVAHSFGVGAKIRQGTTVVDDRGGYMTTSVPANSSYSGTFYYTDIPSTLTNGTYTMRLSVWSGEPGSSTWLNSYDIDFVVKRPAEIISFSPPSRDTLTRGEQTTTAVTIKNTGSTARSFWVGLSFAHETATNADWPVAWFDIKPLQSSILNPGEEQIITFEVTIAPNLRPGQYYVVAAVWNAFNTDKWLLEERFDDTRNYDIWLDSETGMQSFELGPYDTLPDDILSQLLWGARQLVFGGVDLEDLYNNTETAQKPLLYFKAEGGGSFPIHGVPTAVSAGATFLIDLADLLTITPEGKEGWVTVWLDTDGSLALDVEAYGTSVSLGAEIGITPHQFDFFERARADDRKNITGEVSAKIPGFAISLVKYSTVDGKQKPRLEWTGSTALSLKVSGEAAGLVSSEVNIEDVVTALENAFTSDRDLKEAVVELGKSLAKTTRDTTWDDGSWPLFDGQWQSNLKLTEVYNDTDKFAHHFYIDVPENTMALHIKSNGGSPNTEFYAQHNERIISLSGMMSTSYGDEEVLDIDDPTPGKWYVIVPSTTTYDGVNLVAIIESDPLQPQILVTPSESDFGSTEIGSYRDLSFTIENVGYGTLSGNASISEPFNIVSGESYILSSGQSQTVTVRFSPTSSGIFNGAITFSGGGGNTASVRGTGTYAVTAPVINYINDKAITEGSSSIWPEPTLTQGTQPVAWALVNPPSGMYIDSGTGVVSWPNPTSIGSPYTITIRATNSAGSDDEIWLLTVATKDISAPTLNSVAAYVDAKHVDIEFSEPVNRANNAANYSANNGLSISGVTDLGSNSYRLTTSQIDVGVTYTITASNITDLEGNTIDTANNTATLTRAWTENSAPADPSINSPVSGSEVITLMPPLSINASSDADGDAVAYTFEVSMASDFSNIVTSTSGVSDNGTTADWALASELTDNTTYYWRAMATDGNVNSGYMETATFFVNTANDIPSEPAVSYPSDAIEVTSQTPTLSVTNATDADNDSLTYEFDIATDSGFINLIASKVDVPEDSAGATSWIVDVTLADGSTYYWRARSKDEHGDYSDWTVASFFVNISNNAPTQPVGAPSAPTGEVQSTTPTLVVTNATDADGEPLSYIFEIDTVNTFDSPKKVTSPLVAEGAGTTSWTVQINLSDNTSYYWRVKANDGAADSQWSATETFFVNTVNTMPTTPTLANPPDNGGVATTTPVLYINAASDVNNDALTYEYKVCTDSSLITEVASAAGEGTYWAVNPALADNITYWWAARAVDEHGLTGEYMTASSFNVDTGNKAPGAPSAISPSNGEKLASSTPTLTVNNAEDANGDALVYEFEVYGDYYLKNLVASESGITSGDSATSWRVNTSLDSDKTYYWRVRAYDGGKRGAWSKTMTFAVTGGTITGDVDFDGDVDGFDLSIMSVVFGKSECDERFNPYADLDNSGLVDGSDLAELGLRFGEGR